MASVQARSEIEVGFTEIFNRAVRDATEADFLNRSVVMDGDFDKHSAAVETALTVADRIQDRQHVEDMLVCIYKQAAKVAANTSANSHMHATALKTVLAVADKVASIGRNNKPL